MSNSQNSKIMKLLNSIIIAVLFFSILLIPSEDAPKRVFFEYALWSVGALFIIGLIFKYSHDEDEDDQ